MVALKRLSNKFPSKTLQGRVNEGESQLLNTRCADGGWNYGAPAALGINLPSYPETTALALAGLQGKPVEEALNGAERMLAETPSPLARAWLTISLRLNGRNPHDLSGDPSQDVMITALEALSAREGNYRAFLTVAYNGGAA